MALTVEAALGSAPQSQSSGENALLGPTAWTATVLLIFAFLAAAAWTCLSGHKPRARARAPYSVGRFQLVTLRLNSLHDWLVMNGVVARNLAERAAAQSK